MERCIHVYRAGEVDQEEDQLLREGLRIPDCCYAANYLGPKGSLLVTFFQDQGR